MRSGWKQRSVTIGRVGLCAATLLLCAAGDPCERRWTFPTPFYQSISWSPDGHKLAVSAVLTSWDDGYEIIITAADGSARSSIETGGARNLYPVWSPDGKQIAFSTQRDENTDIYVMGSDGTGVRRLTTHEADDSYPTWSPDGLRIAFHSNRDGNFEIYVMNTDGTGLSRVTDHPSDDYNPSWSPDGSKIAFDSDRDSTEGDEIYTVSPDGTDLLQVVAAGVFPAWSPDATRLLYVAKDLHVVQADGTSDRVLVEDVVYGAWSPDGNTIAVAVIEFDAECRDKHSIIALTVDGTQSRTILPR